MSDDNGFVERPTSVPASRHSDDYTALLATVENGQAIRMALNGEAVHVVRQRLSSFVRYRGMKLRCRDTRDGYITAWAEKLTLTRRHEP